MFDYIEMYYNLKRKHVRNGMLSSVESAKPQKSDVAISMEPRAIQFATNRAHGKC